MTNKKWFIVSYTYITECGYDTAQMVLAFAYEEHTFATVLSDSEVDVNTWFQAQNMKQAHERAAEIAGRRDVTVFTVYETTPIFTEEDIEDGASS